MKRILIAFLFASLTARAQDWNMLGALLVEGSAVESSVFDDAITIYRWDSQGEVANKYLRDYSRSGISYATNPASGAGVWTNAWGGAWYGNVDGQHWSGTGASITNKTEGTYIICRIFRNTPIRQALLASATTNTSTVSNNRLTLGATTGTNLYAQYTANSNARWESLTNYPIANSLVLFRPYIEAVAWSNNYVARYLATNTIPLLIGVDTSFDNINSSTGNTNNFLYLGGSPTVTGYYDYMAYFAKWNRYLSSNEISSAFQIIGQKTGM